VNPEMLKQLVVKATANEAALWARAVDGNIPVSEVRKIVDNADVVFAIWQDDNEPNRFGHCIVKGEQLLTDNAPDGPAQNHAVDAIKCLKEADASALKAFCLRR